MFHSVIFGTKNTWDDWHLYSASRPVISMPAKKTNYVDIPGADGSFDFSEVLTKYPLYDYRKGTLKFIVENGYGDLDDRYSEIANYLHGRSMTMKLEDDPDWYYKGTFSIKAWTPTSIANRSTIEIDYILEPYKYYKDEIIQTVDSTSSSEWTTVNLKNITDRQPVCPVFITQGSENHITDIHLVNPELDIDLSVQLGQSIATELIIPAFTLSNISGNNELYLQFKGVGTIQFKYRNGEL